MTSGKIDFTGRMTQVKGVDGFTVDIDNNIFAACWGQGHIAVVDADEFSRDILNFKRIDYGSKCYSKNFV